MSPVSETRMTMDELLLNNDHRIDLHYHSGLEDSA